MDLSGGVQVIHVVLFLANILGLGWTILSPVTILPSCLRKLLLFISRKRKSPEIHHPEKEPIETRGESCVVFSKYPYLSFASLLPFFLWFLKSRYLSLAFILDSLGFSVPLNNGGPSAQLIHQCLSEE